MKNLNFFLVIASIFFFSGKLSANINSKIILKVNNEIVTNYELKNKILTILMLSEQQINQQNINKYKKNALNVIIDNKLKKIEVSKYNIQSDDSEINAYINSISNNNSLKKDFLRNNLDFDLYFKELKIDFAWQKLIYELYKNKIDIDKNALENEINDYINDNTTIEEYRISEIEVSFENNQDFEKKILEIEQEIKNNGFEKTALRYNKSPSSVNGDIGWINSKSLTPEIYNILSRINIGEVTKPIKKQNNLIFLKLTNKRSSNKEEIDVEKLKKDLINKKKNEQFNLYSRSHLLKLKNNSLIEYK